MGNFGGFYKGEKRKHKKSNLDKKAQIISNKSTFILPQVEIIKKGKNES